MGVTAAAVTAVYVVASVVTFAAYGFDKRRAARGGRRVPERTLHLLEALGGWPGALVASAVFRHKTQKLGFRVVRVLLSAAHVAGWWIWLARR